MPTGPVVNDLGARDGQYIVGIDVVKVPEAEQDVVDRLLGVFGPEALDEQREALVGRAPGSLFDKIAVRTARQERLAADDAPDFWAVLNEAVIRRVVGGPDVMREQLNHIAEMADRSRISVQVLPFRAGAHPAMDGSFIVLGFPEPADPDVVYLESQTGSLYLEKLPEVERYQAMFSHLVAKALGPEESVSLIASAAADLA